eukprot:m.202601 g.202601  ORF g.202601 m.202601 type:complete len:179 (-) comp32833_c2_seq2:115-651(-)
MAGILVLQCGGTIDKDYPSALHGYAFEISEPATKRIFECVDPSIEIEHETICRKDSTDMTSDDVEALVQRCKIASQKKILVTHGTSTMVRSGRALAEACKDKTIVITGALRPEQFQRSDACFNVGLAVGALSVCACGVYVAMSANVFRYDQVARDQQGRFVDINTPGAVAGDDPGILL